MISTKAPQTVSNASHRDLKLPNSRHMCRHGKVSRHQHKPDADPAQNPAPADRFAGEGLAAEWYKHCLGHCQIEGSIQQRRKPSSQHAIIGRICNKALGIWHRECAVNKQDRHDHHHRDNNGVHMQDSLDAFTQEQIRSNECNEQSGLVMQVKAFHENGAGACQHDAVDADQYNEREPADPFSDFGAKKVSVQILIGPGRNIMSDQHHFRTQPYKYECGQHDGECSPTSVLCKKLQYFLSGSKSGTDDCSDVCKSNLQNMNITFHPQSLLACLNNAVASI